MAELRGESHSCAGHVFDGTFRGHGCTLNGKYFENGKWYCGIHAPSKTRAKRDKKDEMRKREQEWRAKRRMKNDLEREIKDEIIEVVKQLGVAEDDVEEFIVELIVLADKLSKVRKG